MIDRDSPRCRHCGSEVRRHEIEEAARAQESVEKALGQAQGLKYIGFATLLFAGYQSFFCLFASEIPVHFLALQAVPPVGLFATLNWVRQYGALATDEPDYPEAKRGIQRIALVWVGMLALQFILLGVLGFRIYAESRKSR
jgi:hypothetical protein